ncbi:MAG: aminotransferase DegT [Candidatus Omnitrophica bacterium]|nr:aminotransferase DegT [Candidatus Omnitrophota bacterium]
MEKIPHSRPTLYEEEALAAAEVVRSGNIAQGERVKKFEEELARYIGVKGAVLTNSGSSALHLGLVAMGIGEGDEVLMPSYVCSALLNAVYLTGARPRLCDIEPDTFNISVSSIEDNRTENTACVIVPHMFGSPADLERIKDLGIPVVEDCAQSLGARYGDLRTGSIGTLGMLSFYACKMITSGEGGALVSDDEEVLRIARDRRDYDEKEHYKLRYNYKMTDIQAAVGLVQLERADEFVRVRKEIASGYHAAFSGLDLELPEGEFDHVYYRYVLATDRDLGEVISRIGESGVTAARPVFKPLHRYLEIRSGFKNTDRAYSTLFSVPIYPSLTQEERKKVVSAVESVFG